MRARWLLNLLLLLLIAVLSTLSYLRPGLQQTAVVKTLSSQLPEQVQRLQIEREGKNALIIEHMESGWQLTAPINLTASHFRIEPLLQIRGALSHSSFPAVEAELSRYGLAQPGVWMVLDNERYAFGDVEPLNGYRYVLFDGQVHLLSDRIHHYLRMSPYDFVSLRVLPAQYKVQALRVDGIPVQDELLPGWWQETEARRVSPYLEPETDVEQFELLLDDGSALEIDILQRAPEVVLGIRARGVRYHFRIDEGERLLPTVTSDRGAEGA